MALGTDRNRSIDTPSRSRIASRAGGWLALALLALNACALNSADKRYITECVLSDDQKGTMSGRWKAAAVPIAFHQGQFSAAEMAEIMKAADTWNEFFAESLGLKAIDYGEASAPNISTAGKPTDLCAGSMMSGSKFNGHAVLYKASPWPHSDSAPTAIALTSFCPASAKPYPYIYMAMIELNYQGYFVSGKKQPDMQSILLHEFGHLMGLNHSCEPTTKTGIPNCRDPNINPDYLSASMYPIFGFDGLNLGEQRRSLNDNDQGRMNCLYQGMTPSQ